MKTLKFRKHLSEMILNGEKDLTWRLFDDKNLKEGDEIELLNWETKKLFARALILKMWEKPLKDVSGDEFDGHEKFATNEEMYKTYETYYSKPISGETIAKFIKFKLL